MLCKSKGLRLQIVNSHLGGSGGQEKIFNSWLSLKGGRSSSSLCPPSPNFSACVLHEQCNGQAHYVIIFWLLTCFWSEQMTEWQSLLWWESQWLLIFLWRLDWLWCQIDWTSAMSYSLACKHHWRDQGRSFLGKSNLQWYCLHYCCYSCFDTPKPTKGQNIKFQFITISLVPRVILEIVLCMHLECICLG